MPGAERSSRGARGALEHRLHRSRAGVMRPTREWDSPGDACGWRALPARRAGGDPIGGDPRR
jgi:hypothetical protein